jgi:membrane associated rhomboid family serine protease
MADPPLAASTIIGLGSPGEGDLLRGVSDQTLREVHEDELRLQGSRFKRSAAMTAIFGTAWIAAELAHLDPGVSFLVGYPTVMSLVSAFSAVRQWRTLRDQDPVAHARAEADKQARALVGAAAHTARLPARPPYATLTIAAVLVVVGLLEFVVIGSASRAIAVAGLVKARVAAGEWWRLLTSAFLHANAFHLWANLTALVVFGRMAEAYSTRSRVLLAYLAAVVGGSLASCWLLPHTTSVGASGGILGLVGFSYALSRRRPSEVPAVLGKSALLTMTLTALLGAVAFRFIDNAAHAGGALAGVLVGWLSVRSEPSKTEASSARYHDDRGVAMLGAAAAVVLLCAAILTGAKVFAERPRAVTSVRVAIEPRYSGGYGVAIENLKDVPLEAYTLDVSDSDSPVFQQWRDERGFEANSPDARSIAPHERRTVPLGDGRSRFGHPSIRIAAALFADGSFEGLPDAYDAILERRAAVADDADYLIGVVDQARSLPPDRVVDFVDGKIAERVRAERVAKRTIYTGNVAVLLRADADQPQRFATDVEAERIRLVKLRDDLRGSVR